jgi:hypothetical protein
LAGIKYLRVMRRSAGAAMRMKYRLRHAASTISGGINRRHLATIGRAPDFHRGAALAWVA